MLKKILPSLTAHSIGVILIFALQFISVPLFLKYWGEVYYGEWLILFAIPSYLVMSDMGLGTAATTEMTMLMAKRQISLCNDILNSVFYFIQLVGLFVLSAFLLIFYFFSSYDWFSFTGITSNEFYLSVFLLAAYVLIALILTIPQGFYRVIDKYSRGQNIGNFFRFLEGVLYISVLLMGGRCVEVISSMIFSRLLYAIFIIIDITKNCDWLEVRPPNFKLNIVKPLLKPSISHMTIIAGQSVSIQGVTFLIGICLSPKVVVLFSVTKTLINVSKQLGNIINQSVWVEFSKAYGQNDLPLCRSLHHQSFAFMIALGIISFIGITAFGESIINIWTRGEVTTDSTFIFFFALTIVIDSMWSSSWSMLMAINDHFTTANWFLISALISLFTMYFMFPYLGLLAVPAGLSLSSLIMLIVVIPKALAVTEDSLIKLTQKYS